MSSVQRPITIVGGGLAGLSLGIGLRQLGVATTIWEAHQYPRHRVCGEFINGRGQQVLANLGLDVLLRQAGATFSTTARFYLGDHKSPERAIDPPALCLSRYSMDELLAEHFQKLGGELRQNRRWEGELNAEGVVLANGRRPQSLEASWRWFGLKVHARQVELGSDLEIHGSSAGYVGLCRLPRGVVNVCGLFRRRQGDPPKPAMELLSGLPGSALRRRLAGAVFDEESLCSVGGLGLRPQRAHSQPGCRLGDALTMIPPVTGNGMSMAFEAAGLALAPLAAYVRGDMEWERACRTIASACDVAFRRRLFWARWLQALMLCQPAQGALGGWVLRCDRLWSLLFSWTR